MSDASTIEDTAPTDSVEPVDASTPGAIRSAIQAVTDRAGLVRAHTALAAANGRLTAALAAEQQHRETLAAELTELRAELAALADAVRVHEEDTRSHVALALAEIGVAPAALPAAELEGAPDAPPATRAALEAALADESLTMAQRIAMVRAAKNKLSN